MPFPLVGRDLFEGDISYVLFTIVYDPMATMWMGGMIVVCNESDLHFFYD